MVYGVWWAFVTDTFPPFSLLTYSDHGGILSWWEYTGKPCPPPCAPPFLPPQCCFDALRGLRDADRTEIRKCNGRTTDGRTGVGARDTCVSKKQTKWGKINCIFHLFLTSCIAANSCFFTCSSLAGGMHATLSGHWTVS